MINLSCVSGYLLDSYNYLDSYKYALNICKKQICIINTFLMNCRIYLNHINVKY